MVIGLSWQNCHSLFCPAAVPAVLPNLLCCKKSAIFGNRDLSKSGHRGASPACGTSLVRRLSALRSWPGFYLLQWCRSNVSWLRTDALTVVWEWEREAFWTANAALFSVYCRVEGKGMCRCDEGVILLLFFTCPEWRGLESFSSDSGSCTCLV